MSYRQPTSALSKDRRKVYRLFISHSWDYTEEYKRMVDLLDGVPYFEWENYSVPEEEEVDAASAEELVSALGSQIKPASVVIVLGGMYVAHSEWILVEMILAKALDKPIFGVKPFGNKKMPSEVKERADVVVGWQGSSVADAVRNLT